MGGPNILLALAIVMAGTGVAWLVEWVQGRRKDA